MIFDGNDYFRNVYILFFPLSLSIAALSSFVSALVKTARQKETHLLRAVFSVDKAYALMLPVALFFIVMFFRTMNDYGFALLGDHGSEPLEMTGTIEDIRVLDPNSSYSKFSFEGNTYFGSEITIDGRAYFAVTAGPYQAGDTVMIEYLPKSHCVIRLTDDIGNDSET